MNNVLKIIFINPKVVSVFHSVIIYMNNKIKNIVYLTVIQILYIIINIV